jgi:hypothetical protein
VTDDATGPGTGSVGVAASESADPVESLTEDQRRHRERAASRTGVAIILSVVIVVVTTGVLAATGRLGEVYNTLEATVKTAQGWPGGGW